MINHNVAWVENKLSYRRETAPFSKSVQHRAVKKTAEQVAILSEE